MPAPVLKLLSSAATAPADADLLGRFVASRDEAAFAELVRRHGPAVYRVCKHLLGPSAADDAFQATFLVLACRARAIRKTGSVGSWLIGVAGRVSRQMRRRGLRAAEAETQGRADPARPAAFPAPETGLLAAELAAILDDELTRLPDALRAPVVLCLVEGRTQEQAVSELGGSIRSLRRRLDRAKALLRLRLERRGVVPAVAAGLVAAAGPTVAAVPSDLARRAVAGVFEFLVAGGAVSTPAAVVAKGVVGSMAKLKVSVLMAATAVVMVAIGIVGAGDPPGQITPPPVPSSEPPGIRTTAPTARDSNGVIPPEPFVPVPGQPMPEVWFAYATANFTVAAPNPVMARVIATEAEFQRREQAKWWLGKELPNWPKPCWIRVTIDATRTTGATTFTFPGGADRSAGISRAEMELRGSFLDMLESTLPREVTRTILATRFGKPLPRWADEGIARMTAPAEQFAAQDVQLREQLNAGRGIRLKVLFRMRAYPSDTVPLDLQGHSVVRFLLTRRCPDGGGRASGVDPLTKMVWTRKQVDLGGTTVDGQPVRIMTQFDPDKPRDALLGFVEIGMYGDTDETWNKAAREVYGFESVDKLEEAWLEWLRSPESRSKVYQPDRIPPTKLPGASPRKAPAAPAPENATPGLIPPTKLSEAARQEPAPPGRTCRTANFVVTAPTADMARRFADMAEWYRKDLARAWLGQELPDWPKPCPVRVEITQSGAGGASTFSFQSDDAGRTPGVTSASMELHGPLMQVIASLLPHEVLHTILATHFGKPLPRWADEGIAQTAESAEGQATHAARARELVNAGRCIRLKVLFRMTEYPRDMMVLYAQGHSVAKFLLDHSERHKVPVLGDIPYLKDLFTVGPADHRRRLLAFVAVGMDGNGPESWDKAARTVYGFDSVDKLEEAWLDWLKAGESKPKGTPVPTPLPPSGDRSDLIPPPMLAGAERGEGPAAVDHVSAARKIVLPVAVAAEKRATVREIRIMASRDGGTTWEMIGSIPPDKDRFEYTAPADGVYWVSPVLVYRDGSQDPKDVTREPPALMIRVDTTTPVVK